MTDGTHAADAGRTDRNVSESVKDGGSVPLWDLTGFQRDLLWTAWSLPSPSGQEIKEVLAAESGAELNHGRLYPNLDALVDAGLLAKSQRDRRTNEYDLTDAGREALRARLAWQRRHDEAAEVTLDGGRPDADDGA
jgi:DNA-binding PadR family transcriptional regulator